MKLIARLRDELTADKFCIFILSVFGLAALVSAVFLRNLTGSAGLLVVMVALIPPIIFTPPPPKRRDRPLVRTRYKALMVFVLIVGGIIALCVT